MPPEPGRQEPPAWDAGEPPRAQDGGAGLGDLIATIAEHPFAVLLPLVAATSLALAYLVVTRPTYTASTSILIDARVRQPVTVDASNPVGFPDAALVESQVKLIASDVVLRRVVIGEKLSEDPEFITSPPGLRDRLLGLIGVRQKAQAGDPIPSALYTLARAVTVKRSERTYIMDVEVAAGDGDKAARIANAIARAYIADQQDARAEAAQRDVDFLRVKLEDLQLRVQDADHKVEAYKTQNKISDANGKLINEQQLLEVTTALGAAHARASETKAKYDQVQRLANSGKSADATADAAKSTTLDKLRGQYAEIVRQQANYRATLGPRHPALIEVETQLIQVRKLIGEELKRIAETAANDYQTAHSAELALERQSDALKKSTNGTNQQLVQLRELQREADAQRSVYEKYLRTRETLTADPSEQPIARVIAPAQPPTFPSAPRRAAILSLAFIGGLALGLANALLMHAWRSRQAASAGVFARMARGLRLRRPPARPQPVVEAPIASAARSVATSAASTVAAPVPVAAAAVSVEPSAAEATINPAVADPPRRMRQTPDAARVLGDLPAIAPAVRRSDNWFARHANTPRVDALSASRDQPDSAYAVSIRAILADIRDSGSAGDPQTVLVTARHAGLGVSTLAANLAFAAAADGDLVLLIEANGANPSLMALVPEGFAPTPILLKGVTRSGYSLAAPGGGEVMVVPLEEGMQNEAAHTQNGAGAHQTARLNGIKNNFSFVVIDGATIGAEDTIMMASAATDIVVLAPKGQHERPSIAVLAKELAVPRETIFGLVIAAAPLQGAADGAAA